MSVVEKSEKVEGATEGDSLYLAMEHVRKVLRAETFETGLAFGDEISVTKMDDFDCIPVSIYCDKGWHRAGSPRGTWSMVLASCVPRTGLTATYRWCAFE